MKVFTKIVDLQNALFDERKAGRSVGLVPTMGALHEGHASLVRRSVKDNDVTVVSVFVNPTQFNDQNDLTRYPRTLEADCQLLEDCKADYVLAPAVEEMYPTPDNRQFEYPPVSTVMEGAHRPGHFNGVCQVVSRLFYIVRPDRYAELPDRRAGARARGGRGDRSDRGPRRDGDRRDDRRSDRGPRRTFGPRHEDAPAPSAEDFKEPAEEIF